MDDKLINDIINLKGAKTMKYKKETSLALKLPYFGWTA